MSYKEAIETQWYKFGAIFEYILHWLRGHEVSWRSNIDELCAGDIACETCSLLIWCRACEK